MCRRPAPSWTVSCFRHKSISALTKGIQSPNTSEPFIHFHLSRLKRARHAQRRDAVSRTVIFAFPNQFRSRYLVGIANCARPSQIVEVAFAPMFAADDVIQPTAPKGVI